MLRLSPKITMLGWIFIIGALIGSFVVFKVFDEYYIWRVVVGFILFFVVLGVVIQAVSVPYYTDKFYRAKEYIETHESSSKLEDVSLTNTKIKMNDWLFSAQSGNETFGIFSFFPDSIHDIEPIQ